MENSTGCIARELLYLQEGSELLAVPVVFLPDCSRTEILRP